MNKRFTKFCSMLLTFAMTATTVLSSESMLLTAYADDVVEEVVAMDDEAVATEEIAEAEEEVAAEETVEEFIADDAVVEDASLEIPERADVFEFEEDELMVNAAGNAVISINAVDEAISVNSIEVYYNVDADGNVCDGEVDGDYESFSVPFDVKYNEDNTKAAITVNIKDCPLEHWVDDEGKTIVYSSVNVYAENHVGNWDAKSVVLYPYAVDPEETFTENTNEANDKGLAVIFGNNGIGDALHAIAEVPGAYYYTGKPVKPVVSVYDGQIKLVAGKDYSVKFRNNKNIYTKIDLEKGAREGSDDAPQAIVTFKGAYKGVGKITKYFNIVPAKLTENASTVAVDDEIGVKAVITLKTDAVKQGKKLVPAVTVFSNVKKNKKGQEVFSAKAKVKSDQFSAKLVSGDEVVVDNFKGDTREIKAGAYTLVVSGNGVITGEATKDIVIYDKDIRQGKVTIGALSSNVIAFDDPAVGGAEAVGSYIIEGTALKDTVINIGKEDTVSADDIAYIELPKTVGKISKVNVVFNKSIIGDGKYAVNAGGRENYVYPIKLAKAIKMTPIADLKKNKAQISINNINDAVKVVKNKQVISVSWNESYGWNRGVKDVIATDVLDGNLVVNVNGKSISYNAAYSIAVKNNNNPIGKTTVTITGAKAYGYTGSIKVSAEITATDLEKMISVVDTTDDDFTATKSNGYTLVSANELLKFTTRAVSINETYTYSKGIKPKLYLTFNNGQMINMKKCVTLKLIDNKKLEEGKATYEVKFKGYLKTLNDKDHPVKINIDVRKANLNDLRKESKKDLAIKSDLTAQKVAKKITITIKDNKKTLNVGSDYIQDKKNIYVKNGDKYTAVSANDIVSANRIYYVSINAVPNSKFYYSCVSDNTVDYAVASTKNDAIMVPFKVAKLVSAKGLVLSSNQTFNNEFTIYHKGDLGYLDDIKVINYQGVDLVVGEDVQLDNPRGDGKNGDWTGAEKYLGTPGTKLLQVRMLKNSEKNAKNEFAGITTVKIKVKMRANVKDDAYKGILSK